MISLRGIIISRWDDRLGVVLEGAHPKTIAESLSDDDLLTIFSTHAISEKAGVMAMRIKRLNIISYYSGLPEGEKTDQFFVALILDPDEDPNPYEEGLAEIANMIIPTVGKPGFAEFFAESFDRISKYISINEEQRYSFIFRDNTRRLLLERLANGPMTKEGLAKWISKEIGEEITDIEGLLNPLRKTDLIEEINISKGKKVSLDFVFLIRDVAVIRTPHVPLFNAAKDGQVPPELADKYIDDATRFFKEYRITGQDTVLIANIISEPDTYDIVKILRQEYVTKAELPAKIGREMPTMDKVLKKLVEDRIVTLVKDKKERIWVMLLSDIIFPNFFPEYMIDTIRRRWKEGTIQKEIALKHLELLRAEYIATQAPKFRKKLMITMVTIFKNAERTIKKKAWDQAATMLDQVANYCRDMGERKTGEIVDQSAKGIREDKDQYVQEKWDEARALILQEFQAIEERDKAKEEAAKAKKKAPAKKPAAKKKAPPKKKGKQEEVEEEQEEELPQELQEEMAAPMPAAPPRQMAPPPMSPPPGMSPPPMAAPPMAAAPVAAAPPQTAPASQAEDTASSLDGMDLKGIQAHIKLLMKKGPSVELVEAFGKLSELFKGMGDNTRAEKAQLQQQEMYVQFLQKSEKQLENDAKTAMKKKDWATAVQYYDELYKIANQLFKQGMMQYTEIAKKYQKAKAECESKQ